MVEIKASELLLKISSDVEQLKEIIKLQSFQYTLLLQKLNILTSNQESSTPKQEKVGSFEPVNVNESKSKLSLKDKLEKAKELLDNSKKETLKKEEIKPEQYNFEKNSVDDIQFKVTQNAEDEPFSIGVPEEKPIITQQVPITQLVYTSGGKPVALGAVEVKDQKGKLVQNIKTNSMGRWSVLLKPGEYTIHFVRKYANEIIDYEQTFVVEPSPKQVELLPPEKFRRKGVKK